MKNYTRNATRVICLRGNYHEANFGDDALLVAAYALFASSDRAVFVDGDVAYHDKRLFELNEYRSYSGSADLIVYGGGTQFFDFDFSQTVDRVRGTSVLERILYKLAHPIEFLVSLRARWKFRCERKISVIAIGLGIGPFRASANIAEKRVCELLQRMRFVWIRDTASAAFCLRHDITNVLLSADLCFTNAFDSVVHLPHNLPPQCAVRPRKVGIILRDWPDLPLGFFERFIELAQRLRSANVEVNFLSFSTSDEAYLKVSAKADENAVAWSPDYGAIEKYWAQIADHDLLVTSRYHGAIFSLLSSRAFLTINIEPKLATLSAMVGMPDYLQLVPDMDVDALLTRILYALNNASDYSEVFRTALAQQREKAALGEYALKAFLREEFSV